MRHALWKRTYRSFAISVEIIRFETHFLTPLRRMIFWKHCGKRRNISTCSCIENAPFTWDQFPLLLMHFDAYKEDDFRKTLLKKKNTHREHFVRPLLIVTLEFINIFQILLSCRGVTRRFIFQLFNHTPVQRSSIHSFLNKQQTTWKKHQCKYRKKFN